MNYKRAVKQMNKLIEGQLSKCAMSNYSLIPLQTSAMGRMRQEYLEAISAYMDEVVFAAEDVLAWYEDEIGQRMLSDPKAIKRLKKALKRLNKKEDELDAGAHPGS